MAPAQSRVLVVDDTPGVRDMLDARLRQLGYQPVLAESGEAALAIVDDVGLETIDLVLLDQEMPGLSGIDVLEAVRRQDSEVPVIMLTAHGSTSLAAEFMRRRSDGRPGGQEFLEKPIPREPLFGTLIRSTIEAGVARRRTAAAEAAMQRLQDELNAERQLLLDSLPYPALLLDAAGRVRKVNLAYTGPGFRGTASLGDDYPAACLRQTPGSPAATGLRSVLTGRLDSFTHLYAKKHGRYHRWWRLHACRPHGGQPGAIVSHFDISIEVETQERLRKTKQRLTTLAAHLPAAAVMFSADGDDIRITFARGAGLEDAGLQVSAMEGRSIRELFLYPEDLRKVDTSYRQALAGEPSEYEHANQGRVYLVRTVPIRDDAGKVVEGLCVTTDITSLKKAQERLLKSERFAKGVITSSFGIRVFNVKQGCLELVNDQYTRMTGWTREQLNALSAQEFQTLYHPEDRARVESHFDRILASEDGTVIEVKYRFLGFDRQWRWVHARDTVYERDDDGQVQSVLGFFVDITAQTEAEQARRNLADKQAHLLEGLREGVVLVDGDGTIVTANRAAHELFGYASGALIGVPLDDILPLAGTKGVCPAINAFFEAPVSAHVRSDGVLQARTRTGGTVPISLSLTRVSENGTTLVMALISDATAEEARRRAEGRAWMAEEARRVAEALVLNVMHQLGNFLQELYVFLGLTERRLVKGKPNALEAVVLARGVVDNMGHSFERMQALVRIEAGEADLKLVPLWTADLIGEAIGEVAQIAREHGIEIGFSDSDVSFPGDAGLMVEVIRNLFSNAIKFTPPGGHVQVSVATVEGRVLLRIADTGCGVPTNERERIFHPLYRGIEVRDGRVPGTGVGLAIVERIVRLHGGRIWVEDNTAAATAEHPRGGAIFTIELPVQGWDS